jgi:hypothetical protein
MHETLIHSFVSKNPNLPIIVWALGIVRFDLILFQPFLESAMNSRIISGLDEISSVLFSHYFPTMPVEQYDYWFLKITDVKFVFSLKPGSPSETGDRLLKLIIITVPSCDITKLSSKSV